MYSYHISLNTYVRMATFKAGKGNEENNYYCLCVCVYVCVCDKTLALFETQ